MRATAGLWIRCAAAAATVLGAFGAEAAEVGGGFWPALGRCRISVARDGAGAFAEESNLRLTFDGDPADASGTGRVLVLDETGLTQLHQVPFTWTTGRGRSFRMEPSHPELGEFLVQQIVESVGGVPLVSIQDVGARGALRLRGEAVAFTIRVVGEITGEDGLPRRFKANLRGR